LAVSPFTVHGWKSFELEDHMTEVRDIMTRQVITLSPDADIVSAAKTLLDNRINGAPVVDSGGRLLGILCQSDLIAQQKKLPIPSLFTLLDSVIQLRTPQQIEKQVRKIVAIKVSEAMTADPVTVRPDTDIETAAALMVDKKFHTLPVVEGSRLVGVLGKEDVLRTLLPAAEDK
jgi:CBS domain-containing protein